MGYDVGKETRTDGDTAPQGASDSNAGLGCDHSELTFASGDYYLYCQRCGTYWQMQPEYATNVGIAGRLSGEVRKK